MRRVLAFTLAFASIPAAAAAADPEPAPAPSPSAALPPLPPPEPAPAPTVAPPAPPAPAAEAPAPVAPAPPPVKATSTEESCDAYPERCPHPPTPKPPDAPMLVRRGLQLGLRLGYALPAGTLEGNSSVDNLHVSDLETAWIPIGIDVGYRLSPGFYAGGTLAVGGGTSPGTGSPCANNGVSCSRWSGQLRGELRWYLTPERKSGVWLSLGAGYEVAQFAQSQGSSTITSTFTGLVLPDGQVGVDFRGAHAISVGPYFGVSFCEFLTQGINPAYAPVSTSISDHSLHTWITFGLRGSYGPW